jgi:hypothetical protein
VGAALWRKTYETKPHVASEHPVLHEAGHSKAENAPASLYDEDLVIPHLLDGSDARAGTIEVVNISFLHE